MFVRLRQVQPDFAFFCFPSPSLGNQFFLFTILLFKSSDPTTTPKNRGGFGCLSIQVNYNHSKHISFVFKLLLLYFKLRKNLIRNLPARFARRALPFEIGEHQGGVARYLIQKHDEKISPPFLFYYFHHLYFQFSKRAEYSLSYYF